MNLQGDTMRDFTFYNPTRIEFGKGKENNIGQYVKEFGVGSVLILHGSDQKGWTVRAGHRIS